MGLGSNLGPRQRALERAAQALDCSPLQVQRRASLYETEPVGVTDQPWFLNTVLEIRTALGPRALLRRCQAVERRLGRRPRRRWAEREIDVDVLLFGSWVVRSPALVIPHPQLRFRHFVLRPLVELAPAGVDPLTGETFAELAARLTYTKKVRLFQKRS